MPWWLLVIDLMAIIIVLTALVLVLLVVRRRHLARHSGAFDLSVNRRAEHEPQGWTLGLAVYRGNTLEWYRTFSFSLRPRYRFVRGEIEVEGRREPVGAEAHAVHAGHLVVRTENAMGVQQLALSPDALTGLLAWLEASPPGHSVSTVL
ncbi:MAG: DUF2550 domain-containing protein [Aeromicrobium erythreum]